MTVTAPSPTARKAPVRRGFRVKRGATGGSVELRFGDVTAQVGTEDGCVVQVQRGPRRYLLDESSEIWHTAEQRWGKGFAITDAGAGRWDAPAALEIAGATVSARYEVTGTLTL